MLAAWKGLIAGSGWLTVVDWLRGSHVHGLRCHVDRLRDHMDLGSLVMDSRGLVVDRRLIVGVTGMRHRSF